jgi:hypothetical protein
VEGRREPQVVDGAQLGRRPLALVDEGAVGEHVVDDTEHRARGYAAREADRPTPLDDVGLHDELLGLDVGHVVDAGDVRVVVDLALGAEVLGVGAVPVDVVRRDVEHRRRHG